MGRKCAVPHCYTGYRKCTEKASLYRVPDDDFFLTKWQEAIAREDRPITPKDYVCEKHFKDDDILRKRIIKDVVEEYQRPRLKPDAIPSIFPDLPEFVLKMVKKRRKMPVEEVKNNQHCDSPEKDKSENENSIQNSSEQDIAEDEVKIEPSEVSASTNLASAICETILNNELDIKSESEEQTDHLTDNEGENENSDISFEPNMHHCDQCDYKTKYPHNLRTHKTKHLTGEDAYLHCKHCPKFKTKWELTYRNHLKIKHGIGRQETFKCDLCPFKTKVKLCLKRHSYRHQQHMPVNNIPCDFPGCNHMNESKGALALHKLSHQLETNGETTENSKNFKCTECLYETNSKTHIIRHIKSTHNTGDDTIVSVNAQKNKKSHFQTDSNAKEPLYRCLKCPYKSKLQSSLLKHVAKHKYPDTTDSPKARVWKCPKCPFATFFQHALHRHRETECLNYFVCGECSFKSDSKQDFIKHSLSHRNVSVESVNQEFVRKNAVPSIVNLECDKDERQEDISKEKLVNVTSETGDVNAVPEFITVKNEVPDNTD